MKKYIIYFVNVDISSAEYDGLSNGINLGVYDETFNSKEEADKGLETLIADDKAKFEKRYGHMDIEIKIEDGTYGRKELNVRDKFDGYLFNSTIYEIIEVKF